MHSLIFLVTHMSTTSYDVTLSSPEVPIWRSQKSNSADRMMTPLEGELYDFLVMSTKYFKVQQYYAMIRHSLTDFVTVLSILLNAQCNWKN